MRTPTFQIFKPQLKSDSGLSASPVPVQSLMIRIVKDVDKSRPLKINFCFFLSVSDFGFMGLSCGRWGLGVVVGEIIPLEPSKPEVSPDDDNQFCEPTLTIFML